MDLLTVGPKQIKSGTMQKQFFLWKYQYGVLIQNFLFFFLSFFQTSGACFSQVVNNFLYSYS